MDNRERKYWNIVKGFAVFLMLWGHCIQFCSMGSISCFEDSVFRMIYSFHMPLFMLVSGYLFFGSCQRHEMKELLVRRTQGMLQPIVFFTVFTNLMMLLPDYILSDRLDVLFGALFEGISYSFWFLWAVLLASLVVGFSVKVTENSVLQILLMVFGIFFILLFPQWNESLFMYPFFVGGFFLARYRGKMQNLIYALGWLSVIIFPLMLPFYDTKHFIYLTPVYAPALELGESLKLNLFRWGIGFAGSAFLMQAVVLLIRFSERMRFPERLLDAIAVVGTHSLQIYCLADVFLSGYLPHIYRKLMEPFGGNIFAENMLVYKFVFTPLLALVYAVGLYYVTLLLRKVKLHGLLFGR
ncbi:MAG: acyltransferase family protein [Oscillospiraceae bacterium]|nr:acyltransferase family protein [Oscillospiraceae bacterium]